MVDLSNDIATVLGIEPSAIFEVTAAGVDVAMTMQASQTFDVVVVERAAVSHLNASSRRLLIHNLVANLSPGGLLLTACEHTPAVIASDAEATGLIPCPPVAGRSAWQREDRRNIHDLVTQARTRISRWTPQELDLAQRSAGPNGGPLVLDIRSPSCREEDGIIPGSIHAPRTVLEWRVDPASGYSLDEIHSFDQPLVVVCTGGYSSSLAAATLTDLGFNHAGDLIGGIQAWALAGLPVTSPTNHYMENAK